MTNDLTKGIKEQNASVLAINYGPLSFLTSIFNLLFNKSAGCK